MTSDPTPGDHDELLARTATHRSDGVGGGVALIRELETALRTEQSARQAAEKLAHTWDDVDRLAQVNLLAERDALQQRIDAVYRMLVSKHSPIVDGHVTYADSEIRAALTAPTESEETNMRANDDPEPETPNGVIVAEPDGTQRAATEKEARVWADGVVARGTLAADHPQVILARTGKRTGFLA